MPERKSPSWNNGAIGFGSKSRMGRKAGSQRLRPNRSIPNASRASLHNQGLTIELPNGKAMATYAALNEQRTEAEAQRDRLAAKLRELGIDPDAV